MSQAVGRFAPSPTGDLHLGSALIAIASFLSVKSKGGRWLVRIEDIDEQRTQKGAAAGILTALAQLNLFSDEEIWYQSQRKTIYQDYLNYLIQQHLIYACQCTRKTLQQNGVSGYSGHCRQRLLQESHDEKNAALRLCVQTTSLSWLNLMGELCTANIVAPQDDCIVRRKEGFFSYAFVVVIDDALSNVSEVIRGADLLEATGIQCYLQDLLAFQRPAYQHIPLVVDQQQIKYSKRNKAPALSMYSPNQIWFWALQVLGQQPPTDLQFQSIEIMQTWAIAHWQVHQLPTENIIQPL